MNVTFRMGVVVAIATWLQGCKSANMPAEPISPSSTQTTSPSPAGNASSSVNDAGGKKIDASKLVVKNLQASQTWLGDQPYFELTAGDPSDTVAPQVYRAWVCYPGNTGCPNTGGAPDLEFLNSPGPLLLNPGPASIHVQACAYLKDLLDPTVPCGAPRW